MAFHNRTTDGAMKQETIFTLGRIQEVAQAVHEQDKKVCKFNEEHNVFFNQIVPTIRLDNETILLQTVCLYADGVSKK